MMNNNIDLYNQHKIDESAPLDQEMSDRWELDTTPWINKIYHDLLGETLVGDVYKRDVLKNRLMNELGASAFVQEVNSRISIHMQLSDLTDVDIINICSRAAENFATRIADNYEAWGMQGLESDYDSVADQLFDMLKISLLIARKGGMRMHRERSKRPSMPGAGGELIEKNGLGGAY